MSVALRCCVYFKQHHTLTDPMYNTVRELKMAPTWRPQSIQNQSKNDANKYHKTHASWNRFSIELGRILGARKEACSNPNGSPLTIHLISFNSLAIHWDRGSGPQTRQKRPKNAQGRPKVCVRSYHMDKPCKYWHNSPLSRTCHATFAMFLHHV